MSSDGDTTQGSSQDGGSSSAEQQGACACDAESDLCAKFSAFCDVKTKTHFTSKSCNKLVKDCFEGHYKFKNTILSNRVDSSVFSKCKEKGKT